MSSLRIAAWRWIVPGLLGFCAIVSGNVAPSFIVADDALHSRLWGETGESWDPVGRLPDFSFAGYHRGEQPLPRPEADLDVRAFGAVGDGQSDDTVAFQRAILAARGHVLAIPPGRYKITNFLDVGHSGTVLQGAGPDRSVLVFPIPLNDIEPNWGETTSGQRTSNYSWSGGFIRVAGSFSKKRLAHVTEPASRGDRWLAVSGDAAFRVGDEIRLAMSDTRDNSLAVHLYGGDPGPIDMLNGRLRESFSCRITRVAQRRIHFDRPLRVDVRLEWKPVILSADSSVEEVGIEGLGFEFPAGPYGGHFTEVGFNAMAMSGVRNCWARNLRVHNADSGIFVRGINNTLENIVLTSERQVEKSRRATGHHGVTLAGQDNLLTRFQVLTRFMHDVTLTSTSAGNVVSRGKGIDLALDHHRHGPHSNLFTHINLGLGSRMFQSGGGADRGRHSGAYETFWCIRSEKPQVWPRGWGPDLMNLVGVPTRAEAIAEIDGKWFEAISPERLVPNDLYQAQLARRLGSD